MNGNEIWKCALPSSCDEMMINAITGLNVVSCTIKDVARLAGVSIATVSRVANGGGNVSGKTRTKVLTAISRLQYCPDPHAVHLGRANGRIPKKRDNDVPGIGPTQWQS